MNRLQTVGLVVLILAPFGCTTATAPTARTPALAQSVGLDETVHCMLPARVQKLGGIVYPARRQLVFESAKRCELRGGEYTVYDRATPENSVAFYQPLAQSGDPEAQYNLGLVYESLFAPPNYAEAAVWYRRAAEQNHRGALKNLSYLHETGQGVEKDPLLALNLLRRAGGVTDDLVLASQANAALSAAESEIHELSQRLQQQNAQTAELGRALQAANATIHERRSSLADAQRDVATIKKDLQAARDQQTGAPSTDSEHLRQLEFSVARYEKQIRDQQMSIAELESDLDAHKAQLAASERKATLQQQQLSAQLAAIKTSGEQALTTALGQVAAKDTEINSLLSRLAALKQQNATQVAERERLVDELAASRTRVSGDQSQAAEVARLESEVASRAERIREQTQSIAALEAQVLQTRSTVDAIKAENEGRVREAEVANARLVVTENELIKTREDLQTAQAAIASAQQERQGLLASAQALRSELASKGNTATLEVEELKQRLANQQAALSSKDNHIAELSKQIHDKERAFEAARRERESRLVALRGTRQAFPHTPDVRIPEGKLHALIIGNNGYAELPPVRTAEADARSIDQVLRTKYGFATTLLVNANRQTMMDALLRLRHELAEDDFLLIYYGGHGEVDPNDKEVSYWLPVDARADRMALDTDGIKSTWITNEIRAMNAKHVMIISDSCYAGAMVRPPRVSVPRGDLDARRLQYMIERRSRTVLTSGANSPVLDQGLDPQHSVFSNALIHILQENKGVVYGEWLHAALVERVRYDAQLLDFEQIPQFSEIADADHGNGQFVLLARS